MRRRCDLSSFFGSGPVSEMTDRSRTLSIRSRITSACRLWLCVLISTSGGNTQVWIVACLMDCGNAWNSGGGSQSSELWLMGGGFIDIGRNIWLERERKLGCEGGE